MTAELPTAAEWVRPVNEVSLRIAAGGRIGQRKDDAFAATGDDCDGLGGGAEAADCG